MKQIFWILILCIFSTSCASENSEIERSSQIAINGSVQTPIGTNGALININSDNVMAAGYDSKTGVMSVQFQNGSLYEYYNVPIELWESFISAQPHPWSQVGYPRLVGEGYSYRRIS